MQSGGGEGIGLESYWPGPKHRKPAKGSSRPPEPLTPPSRKGRWADVEDDGVDGDGKPYCNERGQSSMPSFEEKPAEGSEKKPAKGSKKNGSAAGKLNLTLMTWRGKKTLTCKSLRKAIGLWVEGSTLMLGDKKGDS